MQSIGQTPVNLNRKIKRVKLTKKELKQIAEVFGEKYTFGFEFSNNTKI